MEKPTDKSPGITESLAEIEKGVGSLYEAYGHQFPAHQPFWQELANEEKEHAAWLEKLAVLVTQGKATINEQRFNRIAARSFLNYLKEETAKVARQEITLLNAAVVALYLEESIIERHYYEVMAGDDPELRKTFDNLEKATRGHTERLRDFLTKVKNP